MWKWSLDISESIWWVIIKLAVINKKDSFHRIILINDQKNCWNVLIFHKLLDIRHLRKIYGLFGLLLYLTISDNVCDSDIAIIWLVWLMLWDSWVTRRVVQVHMQYKTVSHSYQLLYQLLVLLGTCNAKYCTLFALTVSVSALPWCFTVVTIVSLAVLLIVLYNIRSFEYLNKSINMISVECSDI